jgi:ribonuclease HI
MQKRNSLSHKRKTKDQEKDSDDDETLKFLQEGCWVCYTDGSCKPNPGKGQSAAILLKLDSDANDETKKTKVQVEAKAQCKHEDAKCTNNIAELSGVQLALGLFENKQKIHTTSTKPWIIFTDSKYVIGVLTGKMQAQANRDLIQSIQTQIKSHAVQIQFKWVKGHHLNRWNRYVDQLATTATPTKTKRLKVK